MCCCEDRYFIFLCSLYTHSYFSSRTNAVIACNWALPRELYASLIWPLINFMDWCTVPFALLLKSSTAVMILSRSSLVAVCLSCLSVWVAIHFSCGYFSMRVFFGSLLITVYLLEWVCVFFPLYFIFRSPYGYQSPLNICLPRSSIIGFIFHHKV